ncbi:glycosyltransferase family 2 protein [Magnetococcus sp. PR-3]|uniref:glycosyltransferase family 2 protein n=1 Tax=Magnetococcus sp. PR-3 TaxID=3120355 RepID=UPI002FCE2067
MPLITDSDNTPAAQAISVVIVNHNGGSYLTRAVQSVVEEVASVIVVDNHSTDESLSELEQTVTASTLMVLRQTKNLGFGQGCNLGFAKTNSPYVLFLNPDCIMQPGALTALHHTLSQHSQAGVVGPLIVHPNGQEQVGARRDLPTPLQFLSLGLGLARFFPNRPQLRNYNHAGRPLPGQAEPVQALSGACFLIRRSAFEAVHGFDEAFFFNFEDLDLCLRLGNAGISILFEPSAQVVHVRGVCRRTRPFLTTYHTYRSCIGYFNRHFPHPSQWGWRLMLVGLLLMHSLLFLPKPLYMKLRYGWRGNAVLSEKSMPISSDRQP